MRVLHVLCDLSGGGAERLVLDLCRFAPVPGSNEVAILHRTTAMGGVGLRDHFDRAAVKVCSVDRVRGTPGIGATRRLASHLRGFDVVHTHLWAGDLWGRIAARLAGSRVVVTTEHNTEAEAPWRRSLSRSMAPLSDRVVCVSEGARVAAMEAGWPTARLTVIENGIDVGHYAAQPGSASRRFEAGPLRLLALGRLTRQKGFDLLVDCMRRLPGFHLDIVGEGVEAGPLLARAAGLPVAFHGFVDDVRPWLARADVLVMPSRWEGFGIVAVEAMAAGLPVVASDVAGLREVVADAGVLLPPDDLSRWVARLTDLGQDSSARQRLSQLGRERGPTFDIRRTAERYTALYRTLLDHPGRRY